MIQFLMLFAAITTPVPDAPAEEAPVAQTCPSISVSGAPGDAGEASFFVGVNGEAKDVTFLWSISSGEIAAGQETSAITVKGNAGESVTATVELGGLAPGCESLDSETISFG